MSHQFDRNIMLKLLSRFNDHLSEPVSLFIVGGSALSLHYIESRRTEDIDAIYTKTPSVDKAKSLVADEFNLSTDWLNDGAKGFAPGFDKDMVLVAQFSKLNVYVASPKYLLAMKLYSGRDKDSKDILTLAKMLNLTTYEQLLAVLIEHYPQHLLTPAHGYRLYDYVAALAEGN